MNRFTALAPAVAVLGLGLVVACGQVTGLSDDYTYDLGEGGSQSSGGSSGDAAADADAGACAASTTLSLGSSTCSQCAAAKCCDKILACEKVTACSTRFTCNLDCTKSGSSGSNGALKDCFGNCTDQHQNAPGYQVVGTCINTSCSKECGFQ
jgi:hypothetical protein